MEGKNSGYDHGHPIKANTEKSAKKEDMTICVPRNHLRDLPSSVWTETHLS